MNHLLHLGIQCLCEQNHFTNKVGTFLGSEDASSMLMWVPTVMLVQGCVCGCGAPVQVLLQSCCSILPSLGGVSVAKLCLQQLNINCVINLSSVDLWMWWCCAGVWSPSAVSAHEQCDEPGLQEVNKGACHCCSKRSSIVGALQRILEHLEFQTGSE